MMKSAIWAGTLMKWCSSCARAARRSSACTAPRCPAPSIWRPWARWRRDWPMRFATLWPALPGSWRSSDATCPPIPLRSACWARCGTRWSTLIKSSLNCWRLRVPSRRSSGLANLVAVAEHAALFARDQATARKVTLEVIRNAAAPGRWNSIAGQIHQVLLNLVLNAVQACGEGGSVRVEFFSDERNGHRDRDRHGEGNSPGSAAEYLPAILYYQGERHRAGALLGAPHCGGSRRAARGNQRTGQGKPIHIGPSENQTHRSESGAGNRECLHRICSSVIISKADLE